jgi:adenine-specific DNA-methyltransferase
MPEGTLSAKARRAALEVLSRDRLAEITSEFDLDVEDKRAQAAHIDAIIKARSLDFADVLRDLSRDELKDICSALGLDTSGKKKDLIVDRIVSSGTGVSGTGGTVANQKVGDKESPKFSLAAPEAKPKKTRAPAAARSTGGEPTADYRHDAKRKNNPPTGLIELEKPPAHPTTKYVYDPHLGPQLQWSGKAEHTSFVVDSVSLHIHERVSTQAIMRAAQREDAQRSLFGEDSLPESKAIDFYAHDVGWSNRLVLGDSLLVMNSFLEREQMAGKVQCIYVDPPYGVRFNSNFQPSISRRDVKDGDDASLTREPEQIQAYRDTWTLGVHSYLTYLRDRLLLARDLLSESGSIFVQMSDENIHHVRELLDEVFGAENFAGLVAYKTTAGLKADFLATSKDWLCWYMRDRTKAKFRRLFNEKVRGEEGATQFDLVESPDCREIRPVREVEDRLDDLLRKGWRLLAHDNLTSTGYATTTNYDLKFEGKVFKLPSASTRWKTTPEGMERLMNSSRVMVIGSTPRYKRYLNDFPVFPLVDVWNDTGVSGFSEKKVFVVQTNTKVIERCVLMTTDPGDLVLDPTCGSGTTAYVAEQWGRRWVTCDTSRVALAIARQRILTARFPYFRLRSDKVKDGFIYKTVPHITLKSIAQNSKLDACKTQEESERLIRQNAEEEVLFDQPEEDKGKVRVSGPFTVEAIPVASMEDASESPIPQLEPEAREDDVARPGRGDSNLGTADDYVAYMMDLLKKSGGVHFKNGKNLPLTTLRPVKTPREWLHAESETGFEGEDPRKVAVSFGPRHAPVTPKQVFDTIQQTRGYDIVLFVGFACDPEALAMIEAGTADRIFQFVHAAPDILVARDLLKTSKTTKLFTVFGLPDVRVKKAAGGEVTVTLTGVDIYDPTTGETVHDDGENVAAWFLDHDYDGRTFCVCQAFFPGGKRKNPWEKLQKALKGAIDEDKFETLRGTTSIPFKPGKKVAVKVIDDRGNEVVKVVSA